MAFELRNWELKGPPGRVLFRLAEKSKRLTEGWTEPTPGDYLRSPGQAAGDRAYQRAKFFGASDPQAQAVAETALANGESVPPGASGDGEGEGPTEMTLNPKIIWATYNETTGALQLGFNEAVYWTPTLPIGRVQISPQDTQLGWNSEVEPGQAAPGVTVATLEPASGQPGHIGYELLLEYIANTGILPGGVFKSVASDLPVEGINTNDPAQWLYVGRIT